jgi:hypothetical protein
MNPHRSVPEFILGERLHPEVENEQKGKENLFKTVIML